MVISYYAWAFSLIILNDRLLQFKNFDSFSLLLWIFTPFFFIYSYEWFANSYSIVYFGENFSILICFSFSRSKFKILLSNIAGHGQAAENRISAKFCSFTWWFSYDDDCDCLQKGRIEFCRYFLVRLFPWFQY